MQLTFFCALAIGLTLLIMNWLCLAVSERGIRAQHYADFQTNADSLLSYINNQTILSHSWLAQMEHNYEIVMDIRDGNQPLLYSARSDHEPYQVLFSSVRDVAAAKYQLNPEGLLTSRVLPRYETFPFTDQEANEWYALVAFLPKNEGYLNIAILHSTEPVRQRILRQRLLFGCGSFIAWLLLTVLAWFFIRRMLHPIEENRKNQVQFIASASHELRSPLTVILSALSAARLAKDQEQAHFLDTIESESQRMAHLVNDMLLLANSDNRNWSIHPTRISPDTLLLETYEKYELQARQHHLRFHIMLPQTSVPSIVLDKDRIAQTLSILIGNAFSYTPSGGCVTLSLTVSEKYLIYSVADNGPGILDEHKKKIFDRFYRADDAHHAKEHFGLGLCIAREIVQLHKGKITVTDTPGGGATFLVYLPL